jgi:tetratricopeptide (TPR) repeat protein
MIFLSAYAIAKNEAHNIQRALASIRPYVDEVVIVDTGSTDNTVNIAQSYGARVEFFPWCDDFAAARNYALSLLNSEWILQFDADEEFVPPIETDLRKFLANRPPETRIGLLELLDAFEPNHCYNGFYPRLFRNLPNIRYHGRLHELLLIDGRSPSRQSIERFTNCSLRHYGYGAESVNLLRKNTERNIPLVERIDREEGLSLYLLHYLCDLYESIGNFTEVLRCYERATEELLPYVISGKKPDPFLWTPTWLYNLGVDCLDRLGDNETLLAICQCGLNWCFDYPPILNLTGRAIAEMGFHLGALPYFQASIKLCEGVECGQFPTSVDFYEPIDYQGNWLQAQYNLGVCNLEMQQWSESIRAFEAILSRSPDHQPARDRLASIPSDCLNCF